MLLIGLFFQNHTSLALNLFDPSTWFNFCPSIEKDVPAVIAQRTDFFEELTGVTEPEFVHDQGNLLRQVVHDGRVHNIKTNTSLPAGEFRPYSVAQLTALIENKSPATKQGIFNVLVGYNTRHLPLKKRAQLDIQALQAAPENKDALFQVASNFDCRENASSAGEGHHWISEYVDDMTQGPFAAISAAPGLFLRCYSLRPINLLKNLPFLHLRKGYLVLDQASDDVLEQAAALDYQQVMVGVHRNVGVAYGQLLDANQHLTCVNREQAVSQVYVSSLDFGTASGNALGKKIKKNGKVYEQVEALAKKLLLAAYEGTIKAAIAFDNKKVFLTLVGCGVFNNKLTWVQEAIENCLEDIKKFGLDVTLVVYDANSRSDMKPFLDEMKRLTLQTKGDYQEIFDAFGYVQSSDGKGRLR